MGEEVFGKCFIKYHLYQNLKLNVMMIWNYTFDELHHFIVDTKLVITNAITHTTSFIPKAGPRLSYVHLKDDTSHQRISCML